jgi:hypothetical protein
MTKKNVAIVIGNGVSRKELDLNSLVGHGTIYGCNALYREFSHYDHLIAIDDGMIEEIKNDPKAIIPPIEERFESSDYNPFQRRRSNAGMNAMYEAVKAGNVSIFCIGFDFILEGDISVDNIFKGTKNYGPETHANVSDNYYRLQYLQWFISKYKTCSFWFVIPDDAEKKNIEGNNVFGIHLSRFINMLETE